MADLGISTPLWVILVFSLFPLVLKLIRAGREPSPFVLLSGLGLGILASMVGLWWVWPEPGLSLELFSGALLLDAQRAKGTLLLQVLFLVVMTTSAFHPQLRLQKFSEILFLKMGALAGLMLLLWSKNMLVSFVSLEMASMAFYLLLALALAPGALRSAFMYFVLGSVAAAVLLYGMAFVFGSTGTLDWLYILDHNPELLSRSRLLLLGLVLVVVGFLFKLAIFPFQFWMPDLYHSSPVPLLVFMAGGFKVSVFVLLFQWTEGLFVFMEGEVLLLVFQWMAVLSVLFGNIAALMQPDIKKMLLFSSVAHSGYLLMILITGGTGEGEASGGALLYYLMVYVLMLAGAFICLRPFENKDQAFLPLNQLKARAFRQPFAAFFLMLFLFGLAGLPPTGGFIAKLLLFKVLLSQGLAWMVFWLILGSAIGLFYYLRPVALMYMHKNPSPPSSVPEKQREVKKDPVAFFWAAALGLALVLSGLFPSLFL